MNVVAWDTETSLICPALLAPPLVCVTWQEPGKPAQIAHVSTARAVVEAWLRSDVVLVGHNVAYDLAVVCERWPDLRSLVFAAYAADRVTDTMIRQQLLDIAAGVYRRHVDARGITHVNEYTLEALAKRVAGMQLLKDGWRLSYGEFLDTPLAEWPRRARDVQAAARERYAPLAERRDEAVAAKDDELVKALSKEIDGILAMIAGDPNRASEYPLDDARATLAVYLQQEKHAAVYLKDQFRQARAAWALHLSSAWGIRTDAAGVELLRSATQAAYDDIEQELIQLGLIRNDKKRTRDTKAAKARMIAACLVDGLNVPRTDGHTEDSTKCRDAAGNPLPGKHDDCVEHVCLDAESCGEVQDTVLHDYAEISTLKKVLSNDIKSMLQGLEYPLHTRYGLAKTGRTTSSKPNIQNQTTRVGFRECFVPRPGMVFFAADFPGLELYTWAQCCVSWLGQSRLAEELNAGIDPHTTLAAQLLGTSYEDVKARRKAGDQEADDLRQLAKIGNFGFQGGMGAVTLLANARKKLGKDVCARLQLDDARMVDLKEAWLATWPEAKPYFDRVKSLGPPYGERFKATVESLFTGRFRGDCTYCATANTPFQGLGVDCAKEALWRITREQYDCPDSPLYNTRTPAFVHDEYIGEAPIAVAHDAAMRLADVMVEGANVYLPDVQIPRAKVEPVLMTRWSKKAKPVFGADGRLVVWA